MIIRYIARDKKISEREWEPHPFMVSELLLFFMSVPFFSRNVEILSQTSLINFKCHSVQMTDPLFIALFSVQRKILQYVNASCFI
jgi:hypothetical protein